ncbi:MAG: hypothetical protein IKL88_07880 [Erysipelotrichales bacterium]|nr:hypothetical protein [Erysipelotrichales bacterium]
MANNTLELLKLLNTAKEYVDEDTLASVAGMLAKGTKSEKKDEKKSDNSGLEFLLKAMSGLGDSKNDDEAREKEDAALISILEARGYTVTKKGKESDVMGILSSLGEKAEEAGLMDKLGDILVDSAKKATSTKKSTTKKSTSSSKKTSSTKKTTTKKTTTKKTTKK